MTRQDWATKVEQELFTRQRHDGKFNTLAEAKRYITPEDQIIQCNECNKYIDEYYSQSYAISEGGYATACHDCMTEKRLNLPAYSYCQYCAPADEMYITGGYNKRYFCDYKHQCIFWFNRGG